MHALKVCCGLFHPPYLFLISNCAVVDAAVQFVIVFGDAQLRFAPEGIFEKVQRVLRLFDDLETAGRRRFAGSVVNEHWLLLDGDAAENERGAGLGPNGDRLLLHNFFICNHVVEPWVGGKERRRLLPTSMLCS